MKLTSSTTRRACAALVATLLASLLAVVPLSFAAPVSAQEPSPPSGEATATSGPLTWSLKPSTAQGPDARPHFVYDARPGQTVEDVVAVTNYSDSPLRLDLYAADGFTPDDGGFDLRQRGEVPTDVAAWVTVRSPQVDVAARSTVLVPLVLVVPENATPGDHVGGVVASFTTTVTDGSGQQVAVENRVGSRIYLRVDGPLEPRLEIVDLRAGYDGTLNPVGQGAVDVSFTVVNTGNIRLSGQQVVTVTGPFGVELGRVVLADVPELLPGARQEQVGRIDGVWPAGRLSTEVELWAFDPVGEVEVPPTTASVDSWAVPWTLLLVLAVVAAGGLVRRARRRSRGPVGGSGSATPSGAPGGPSAVRGLEVALPRFGQDAGHAAVGQHVAAGEQ
jgi:hypothetical protein